MKLEDLEFGVYKEIEPQIVEVLINEGVILDIDKVQRAEEALLEKYNCQYACLVNRINRYSHTHESMGKVAKYRNLAGMAVLVYDEFGRQAAAIHKLYQDNVAVFEDREKAIIWLRNLLKKTSSGL